MSKGTSRKPKTINPRQEIFALNFCIDLNATRAALSAGYGHKGAAAKGCQLLKNRLVARRIDQVLAKRANRLEISGERCLERAETIADGNMADFVTIDEDGAPHVSLAGKTRADMYCIQRLQTDTYVTGAGNQKRTVVSLKIELQDRQRANEFLAKYKIPLSNRFELGIDQATLNELTAWRKLKESPREVLEVRALELLAEMGPESSELKERASKVLSVTTPDANQRSEVKDLESST